MPKLTPERAGEWALLTGGSSGIGFAHARLLAERGFKIALVGRDKDKLARAAAALKASSNVEVDTLSTDLGDPRGSDRVMAWIADREIGVYVSTAGGVAPGDFVESRLDEHLAAVNVKATATLGITHAIASRMRARGAGAVLLVSSATGMQGIPSLAANAGLEAFVYAFAESLHHELKPHGVVVTALLPGSTTTEGFFNKVPQGTAPPRGAMTPEATAAEGIAALERGEVSHVAGAHNRLLMGVLPRKARTALMGRVISQTFALTSPSATTHH